MNDYTPNNIRYCGICGKEISYDDCINISALSKNIRVDIHRRCFITIADIQKIHEFMME